MLRVFFGEDLLLFLEKNNFFSPTKFFFAKKRQFFSMKIKKNFFFPKTTVNPLENISKKTPSN